MIPRLVMMVSDVVCMLSRKIPYRRMYGMLIFPVQALWNGRFATPHSGMQPRDSYQPDDIGKEGSFRLPNLCQKNCLEPREKKFKLSRGTRQARVKRLEGSSFSFTAALYSLNTVAYFTLPHTFRLSIVLIAIFHYILRAHSDRHTRIHPPFHTSANMGLSGPKQKQRLVGSASTRNTAWLNDSSAPGQRMLAEMGWSSGQSLGLTMPGLTENLKVAYKMDNKGIGAQRHEREARANGKDIWVGGGGDLGSLFERLNAANAASTLSSAVASSSASAAGSDDDDRRRARRRRRRRKT